MKSEVPFLGHIVSTKGIKMDPKKIKAVQEMTFPDDVTKLRSFLGATSHYRKFIKDYVSVALPLTELLKQPSKITEASSSQVCVNSFNSLKEKLMSNNILSHPDIDRQWVLSCDASAYGIACVLQQRISGVPDQTKDGKYTTPKNSHLQPIAFFSKKLNDL